MTIRGWQHSFIICYHALKNDLFGCPDYVKSIRSEDYLSAVLINYIVDWDGCNFLDRGMC
jgi:hypothetical protein